MKNMKKYLSLIIIFSLYFNTCAFAKDYNATQHIYKNRTASEKQKLEDNLIEFNEIDDLVNAYNATVRNNWNNYESNKDSTDIYDDYMDAYNSLDALASSAESDVTAAMYRAQADAMRINADNNVVDSQVNFLSYLITEKNLVLSTKLMFINNYKYQLQREIAAITSEEYKRQYETAKNNYDNGNMTRIDYLNTLKQSKDQEAEVVLAKSNIENNRRNLLINCGKSITDAVVLGNVNLVSVDTINKIDVNKDIENAIENNYQYDIYKRQLANATTQEKKNQNQIYVNSAPNFIKADIEKKYSDLQDAVTSLSVYSIAKEYYDDNYKSASNEYEHGSISRKDFQTANYQKENARLNVLVAQYDLEIAYQTYLASVEGLASAGS